MKHFATALLCGLTLAWISTVTADQKPNVLIITVDDMSCDSVGAFGCELAETTPTIDALAASGMRFHYAHVQVGNCFPSRNVMFSGRYPHNTGVEGFYQVRDTQYAHLVDAMKDAGYYVAIRGKVTHSTPYQPYAWDQDLTIIDGQKQHIKNADSYYRSTKLGIQSAAEANKPFCINVNVSDPHKPFYAMSSKGQVVKDDNVPSKIFTADEVPIPGFLFDHPDVRKELAHYYSSVRRADDCVASVLKALHEAGNEKDTVVFFLSDHGMPLPFAKTALWHHSTRTPWIVRWPGVTTAGSVDRQHMISAVDLMPTLLDILDLPAPNAFDGSSFRPLLEGGAQPGRDVVYKVYNENSGGNRSPMRSVETKRFGYIFNPWSDGKRIFKTATQGTMSYRAMRTVASSDPVIAARLQHFNHNVLEEFYDYQADPDALHNLIDDPQYQKEIEELRAEMRRFMVESNDPILAAFDKRHDLAAVSAYVDQVQAESDARRARKRTNKSPQQDDSLFRLVVPKQVQAGQAVLVKIRHTLPKAMAEQQFHVTLKNGDGGRVERIVKTASGDGVLEIEFDVPANLKTKSVVVSAFVGPEYGKHHLHRTKGGIAVTQP